jgi:hypothetical protein
LYCSAVYTKLKNLAFTKQQVPTTTALNLNLHYDYHPKKIAEKDIEKQYTKSQKLPLVAGGEVVKTTENLIHRLPFE